MVTVVGRAGPISSTRTMQIVGPMGPKIGPMGPNLYIVIMLGIGPARPGPLLLPFFRYVTKAPLGAPPRAQNKHPTPHEAAPILACVLARSLEAPAVPGHGQERASAGQTLEKIKL